jgi:hypothetical protein
MKERFPAEYAKRSVISTGVELVKPPTREVCGMNIRKEVIIWIVQKLERRCLAGA